MTAFSNGTEWDAWSYYWCDRCKKEPTCGILDMVFIENEVPPEWTDNDRVTLDGTRYTCTEFVEDV